VLNSRAIALQGVGYSSRVLALQGFYPVDAVDTVDVVKTGSGGIDGGKRSAFKPTGETNRKKQPDGRKTVDQRIADSENISAEILAERDGLAATAIQEAFKRADLVLRERAELEIDAGVFEAKRLKAKDDEEIMMLLLIAATQ